MCSRVDPKVDVLESSEKKNVAEDTSDKCDVEGIDSRCIYCIEKYSETKRSDGWIRCRRCEKWAHENCTAWPDKALDYFECNDC
jgi:hypothetical protein